MKKIILLPLLAAALFASEDRFEYKDETLRIRISKDSVNRIILPADILGKIHSDEKNLNIKTNAKEAYIKVTPTKKTEMQDGKVVDNEIVYTDTEAEVFFLTEKKTYAVVFVPDNIETRTVFIDDNTLEKEDVAKVEKGSSEYAKNIKNIFRLAIENRLSNSFTKTKKNIKFDNFLYLDRFDGSNYQVHKFFIFKDEVPKEIDSVLTNHIVAAARFEQNYFVLTAQNKR